MARRSQVMGIAVAAIAKHLTRRSSKDAHKCAPLSLALGVEIKDYKLRILILFLSLCLTACSTLVTNLTPRSQETETRISDDCAVKSRVYSGTQLNYDCLTEDDYEGMGLLCLIDIPLSLALDTIVLPYTIYKQYKYGNFCAERDKDI